VETLGLLKQTMDHIDTTIAASTQAHQRPPRKPPAWFVHTAWRIHRGLYRLSGGRFLWTTSNKRAGERCS